MNADPLVESLAATLHAIWCRRLSREGWRRGVAFDADRMVHDALVPYAELGSLDRRYALGTAEMLAEDVRDLVEYPRGDDREFTTGDIRVGQEVVLKPGRTIEGNPDPGIGHIVGWQPEDDPALVRSVTVQWANGATSEHPVAERDLRRVEPGRS